MSVTVYMDALKIASTYLGHINVHAGMDSIYILTKGNVKVSFLSNKLFSTV